MQKACKLQIAAEIACNHGLPASHRVVARDLASVGLTRGVPCCRLFAGEEAERWRWFGVSRPTWDARIHPPRHRRVLRHPGGDPRGSTTAAPPIPPLALARASNARLQDGSRKFRAPPSLAEAHSHIGPHAEPAPAQSRQPSIRPPAAIPCCAALTARSKAVCGHIPPGAARGGWGQEGGSGSRVHHHAAERGAHLRLDQISPVSEAPHRPTSLSIITIYGQYS